MEDFFTVDGILDPAKIRAAGFVAYPYPEYISTDEIESVMHTLKKRAVNIWSFEFQNPPQKILANDSEVAKIVFDEAHKNLFLSFYGEDLFIWIPEGQDHFLIFGDERTVAAIRKSEIFEYTFEDFLNEDHFSKAKIDFLREIQTKYTIESSEG